VGEKKKPDRSRAQVTGGFLKNLTSGDYGPIDRTMRVLGNLGRRNIFRRGACCGNYGDPGC
jgi:hypothetical protein